MKKRAYLLQTIQASWLAAGTRVCVILLALDEEACLPASNRFIPVCVYAKTRDLILLRSCYADAGETELA